jgi:hypothetical protein
LGLVIGPLKLWHHQMDAQPVIVWGTSFPSWLLVLEELRLHAHVVVFTSEDHFKFVRDLVEEDCLIMMEDKAKTLLLDPKKIGGNCSLCLFDKQVESGTAHFSQTHGVTQIVNT